MKNFGNLIEDSDKPQVTISTKDSFSSLRFNQGSKFRALCTYLTILLGVGIGSKARAEDNKGEAQQSPGITSPLESFLTK